MDAQLLYQQDVTTINFEASVVERLNLPAGRIGVVLDHTYFYPTGGGQEHDTGCIGYPFVGTSPLPTPPLLPARSPGCFAISNRLVGLKVSRPVLPVNRLGG